MRPMITLGEKVAFERSTLTWRVEQTEKLGGKMYYYNLWPNTKLEQYLRTI